MSTLHERLLRWFDHGAPHGDLEDAIAREEAALRAVVELHAPATDEPSLCRTCWNEGAEDYHGWPCSTIKTIAEHLGVEIGETP